MIERFWEQYRWLSNFWEVEIEFDGITYPSVEHYYVAMKVDKPQKIKLEINKKLADVYMDIQQLREHISKIDTASKVKKFGQEQISVRKDWDDLKISVMKYGLEQKYSQEPFRTKLIETGNEYIQEGNVWNDTHWGVNLDTGEGKNILGKMIMKIREDLLKDKGNG